MGWHTRWLGNGSNCSPGFTSEKAILQRQTSPHGQLGSYVLSGARAQFEQPTGGSRATAVGPQFGSVSASLPSVVLPPEHLQ